MPLGAYFLNTLKGQQCLGNFLKFLFTFLCYVIFLLNIVDLQCCASFRCIESKSESFQILFPYRLLQNIEYGSLCYAVDPCWSNVLYILVCIKRQPMV